MLASVGRVVLLCGFVASLAACRSPARTVTSPGAADPSQQIAAERWQKATQGLAFDSPTGLVVVGTPAPAGGPAAAELVAQGDDLFESNRVFEALDAYALAARTDPSLADAYVGLGKTARAKGKIDPAITAFRTAVDRDPRHVEARYQLAMALWAKGDSSEAIHEMNAVLVEDESHVAAHQRLAVWSYYSGAYADAWTHVHRAEELGGVVPAQLASMLSSKMPDPAAE